MNKLKYTLLFTSIILFAQSIWADCMPSSKGDQVIKNMILKYQSFLEYNDNGAVYRIKTNNIKERKNKFSTSFEAPDKFKFQWVEKDIDSKLLHNKVWGENQTANMLMSYSKETEKMSTSSALSSAHGVSGGVSFVVLPWMLFQLDPCLSIKKVHYKIVKEIQYNGRPTYIIRQSPINKNYEIMWITKDKLILRKIEKHYFFRDGSESIKSIEYINVSYK